MYDKPTRIGDYRVVGMIATTGNAHLYQAVERVDGQEEKLPYVLKELKKNTSELITLRKEKDITHYIEMQSRKSILIPILKVIKQGDKEYAVMQLYHHGKILSECIEELESLYGNGKIPLLLQMRLLCTILDSLQELHGADDKGNGYLHLDLHPGNIFLENCDVVQGEFGVAKFLDFQNALKIDTNEKVICDIAKMGVTPGFGAPELCSWNVGTGRIACSPATDLYAVAAIGARIFTGRTVHTYMETFLKIIDGHISSGVEEDALSVWFVRILKMGLNTNSKYRFQNVKSMKMYLYSLIQYQNEIEAGEYYRFFSAAYDHYIPLKKILPEKIKFSAIGFHRAVGLLKSEIERQDNDIVKCHYVFSALWKMSEFYEKEIPDADIQELMLYGIESNNYMGDSNRAIELFEQLQCRQKQIPLMGYLKLMNVAAEFYVDTYQYEKALLLMEKNKSAFEKIQQVYKEVAVENGLNPITASWTKEQAKTYMNYGRYLIYLQREGGIEYLQQALKEFEKEEDDRQITISHILHYAIEDKNPILYEYYAREYLGFFGDEKSFVGVLMTLLGRAEDGALWRIWIFLKGMYTFYMPLLSVQEKEEFCAKLCDLVTNGTFGKNGSYPVEHIYKYIALILWSEAVRDGRLKEFANKSFMLAITHPKTERINRYKTLTIRMLMKYQILALYLDRNGETEDYNRLRDELRMHSKESGWDTLTAELEAGCPIEEILGYEHC